MSYKAPHLVGARFGEREKYEVQSEVGGGGHAWVFRAIDTVLNRSVAVKLLRRDVQAMDELAYERFEQEARVLASLDPRKNLLSVHDFGKARLGGQEYAYLVMEWLEGMTLRQWLERHGALKPLQVATLLRDLLVALSEAHGKGIIHRDIKPENIMVRGAGADLRAILFDFGIVKTLDPEPGSSQGKGVQTAVGSIIGTPLYLTPEQLEQETLGPFTDIYALGLVALECLVGKHPYRDERGEPFAEYRLMKTILFGPELRVPDAFSSTPLHPLLNRMLHKKPAERYQTAQEVSTRLEELGREHPHMAASHGAHGGDEGEEGVPPAERTLRLDDAYEVHRHTDLATRDASYEAPRLAAQEFGETRPVRPARLASQRDEDRSTLPLPAVGTPEFDEVARPSHSSPGPDEAARQEVDSDAPTRSLRLAHEPGAAFRLDTAFEDEPAPHTSRAQERSSRGALLLVAALLLVGLGSAWALWPPLRGLTAQGGSTTHPHSAPAHQALILPASPIPGAASVEEASQRAARARSQARVTADAAMQEAPAAILTPGQREPATSRVTGERASASEPGVEPARSVAPVKEPTRVVEAAAPTVKKEPATGAVEAAAPPVKEPVKEEPVKPVNESVKEPVKAAEEPVKAAEEPVKESVKEPVKAAEEPARAKRQWNTWEVK